MPFTVLRYTPYCDASVGQRLPLANESFLHRTFRLILSYPHPHCTAETTSESDRQREVLSANESSAQSLNEPATSDVQKLRSLLGEGGYADSEH